VIEQGRGERFRQPSVLERVAVGVGALLPPQVRKPAAAFYARLLDRVRAGELVAELPMGERVQLPAHHRYLSWNRDEYAAFRADVRPGDVVLDVGANAGAYTVLFAGWVGRHGHVYAFEPATDTRRLLDEVIALNGVADRVTTVGHAVGGEEGRTRFTTNGSDGTNRVVSHAAAGTIEVPATTIDAFCERLNVSPALIKVDVEGAELEVLRGARRTIARLPGMRLYVEMHPRTWQDGGVTACDVEQELAIQGLRAERLDGRPGLWNIEGVCLRLVRCGS
jgi:FkbM family methyltransferase